MQRRIASLKPMLAPMNLSPVKRLESDTGYGKGLGGRPWRRLVEQVKVRDRYTCQSCGRITTDGECDHRIPRARGGTDDLSNLQWLCAGLGSCHEAKSRMEAKEGTAIARRGDQCKPQAEEPGRPQPPGGMAT